MSYLVPGWPWLVSGNRLFFGTQEVPKADLPTFQALNEWWGRDANRVHCAGSEVRGADTATFQVLNSLYAKDAQRAYTIAGPIRESDPSTFVAVGPVEHAFNTKNGYAKDARSVFHTIVGGKASVVKGADAATFSPRGHGYGSDEATVYFERKKVPGAKPAEWSYLRGPHSHSKRNAYVLGRRIRGADGNRLESLPILEISDYWCRDDKAYYRGDQVSDPEVYLRAFRRCFIFRGRVSNVSLSWNRTERLDPAFADSWRIAERAWIFVDCKEWMQQPELDVAEVPRVGEPFKFGEGLYLSLLASPAWREEDRIWIFQPRPDSRHVERPLVLPNVMTWWEYSSLDQLDSIERTIAAAASV